MDNYKYNEDQMRPKLIEMLYRIRREAAKYRDICDIDSWTARNNHENTAYFDEEAKKYEEIIRGIDEIIDILR